MIVEQIMTRRPETVEITAPLREAVWKLFNLEIRHLPVTDKGELVGMLSDRDVRSYLPALGDQMVAPRKTNLLLDTAVSDAMQSNPITIDDEAHVNEVIDLMLEHKVGALPVLDSLTGKLKGIVSYIDILKNVRAAFE